MAKNEAADSAYRSARDLPKFREMEAELSGLKTLLPLAPLSQRKQVSLQLAQAEAEMNRISSVIDAFYEKLGNRNWIYTDDLHLEAMERIVGMADAAEAERALITYYRSDDRVAFSLRRMQRFDALRPRMPLLWKALEDYLSDRHYSVAFVLIAVMDGFVSDLERWERRGLHAREPGDMFAWDSVIGHHLGLTHALKAFAKPVKATRSEEIFDLQRHGIVHGMNTNFDNATVSTKAWNMLFALGDWADAKRAKADRDSAAPEPSLADMLRRLQEVRKSRVMNHEFEPYECRSSEEHCEVLLATTSFFEDWKRGRWAPLGKHFIQWGKERRTLGELAREAKSLYEHLPMEEASVHFVEHFGSMGARSHATVTLAGIEHEVTLRWLHVDSNFEMVHESEDGAWKLSPYGPSTYMDLKN